MLTFTVLMCKIIAQSPSTKYPNPSKTVLMSLWVLSLSLYLLSLPLLGNLSFANTLFSFTCIYSHLFLYKADGLDHILVLIPLTYFTYRNPTISSKLEQNVIFYDSSYYSIILYHNFLLYLSLGIWVVSTLAIAFSSTMNTDVCAYFALKV